MKILLLLIFLHFVVTITLAEPITIGAAVIGVSSVAGWLGYRWFRQCSGELKDLGNFRTNFEDELNEHFFGQHIAFSMVGHAIQQHLESKNPNKALTLAFLGATGRGKTYLTTLLADTLFASGEKSPYYHKFVGTERFVDDQKEAREYARNLVSWIKGNLTECSTNVFVFDEMDKFPRVIIDSLQEFLDFDAKTYGKHNSRKSIFIFLCNTAKDIIDGELFSFLEAQKSRESLRYDHLKLILREAAFNDGIKFRGLKDSEIVRKSLINYYIPFLPLQRTHILQCIEAFIKKYNQDKSSKMADIKMSRKEMLRIADDLEYSPEEKPIFSKNGCKTIKEVVTTAMFKY